MAYHVRSIKELVIVSDARNLEMQYMLHFVRKRNAWRTRWLAAVRSSVSVHHRYTRRM